MHKFRASGSTTESGRTIVTVPDMHLGGTTCLVQEHDLPPGR